MVTCNLLVLILVTIFLKVSSAEWVKYNKTFSIERMYKNEVITNKRYKNSVCDLPKYEKMGICEALFERPEYKTSWNIFMNLNAYKHASLECVPKELTFLTGDLSVIQQKMFPCYGRHDPMRTDVYNDDYLYTVHVSGDYNQSILFVYKMVTEADRIYIKIQSVYHNVIYGSILPRYTPSETELEQELMTLRQISFARSSKGVEIIHLREVSHQLLNPVCILDKIKKIKLCRRIFERRNYLKHEFVLNIRALSDDEPKCEEKFLSFPRVLNYNPRKERTKQLMLPCFGQYLGETTQSWRDDKFLKQFSIAAGPRKNSVFVYSQLGDSGSNLYRVYEFIQNINLGIRDKVENDASSIQELLTDIENRRVVLPRFYSLVIFDEEEEEQGMKNDYDYGERDKNEEKQEGKGKGKGIMIRES